MPSARVLGERRAIAIVVLVALATTVAFATGAVLRDEVYATHVDVELITIAPETLYDASTAEWSDEEAMASALAFLDSAELQAALDAELTYPHDLHVHQVGPTTLRFDARSESPELAVATAAASASVFGAVRERVAKAEANAIIVGERAAVAELEDAAAGGDADAAAELPAAQERLRIAEEGRVVLEGGTAYVVEPPVEPSSPIGVSILLIVAVGLVLGLVLGAGVAWVDAYVRERPEAAVVTTSARLLGAGDDTGPHPDRARIRRWLEVPWAPFALLGGLVVGRFVVYALLGANLVLDDITLSYFGERNGLAGAVPVGQDLSTTRPGAWLTFTIVHGLGTGHPLLMTAMVTVVNLGIAWTLYVLVRRFLSDGTALWVAVVWVLLPTHTTLTVWPGTAQIVVGLLLLLVGADLFARGSWLPAGVFLAGSILCYEIAIPVALLVPLVLATPVLPLRADSTIDPPYVLRERLGTLVPVVFASAWSLTHPIYDLVLQAPNVIEIWNAHHGLGLYGSFSTPERLLVATAALIAALTVLCLGCWALGQRGRGEGPSLVLVGGLIMGAGLPVAITLGVSPLGFGDRLLGISSVGSSLVLVGIGTWLWARSRTVATVGASALLAVCLAGTFVSLRSWSDAGQDVVSLIAYVEDLPEPTRTDVWIESGPLNRNGVIGASSPDGGANEAYLRAFPDADPDGPGEGEPATGSLTIPEVPEEAPDGALVVTWGQVLNRRTD